jgi:hypothetical protein
MTAQLLLEIFDMGKADDQQADIELDHEIPEPPEAAGVRPSGATHSSTIGFVKKAPEGSGLFPVIASNFLNMTCVTIAFATVLAVLLGVAKWT